MQASFYEKLQNNFIMIRFMQYPNSFDQEKYDLTVLSIREARDKINMNSAPDEKNILLYCIDTLFVILNEGDKQKIFDFADAIHNIPEIYMQKRNLYSFREEFKAFQKKYGKHYFAFINEVKPHFTKKASNTKKREIAINTHLLLPTIMFLITAFMSANCIKERDAVLAVGFAVFALLALFDFLISPMYYVFSEKGIVIIYLWKQKEEIEWNSVRDVTFSGCWIPHGDGTPHYHIAYPTDKQRLFFIRGDISKTGKTERLLKMYSDFE